MAYVIENDNFNIDKENLLIELAQDKIVKFEIVLKEEEVLNTFSLPDKVFYDTYYFKSETTSTEHNFSHNLNTMDIDILVWTKDPESGEYYYDDSITTEILGLNEFRIISTVAIEVKVAILEFNEFDPIRFYDLKN